MSGFGTFAVGARIAYDSTMTTLTILPTLETPHLILREMRMGDAEELSSFMTQPRYQKYISHKMKDDAEVHAFVRRHLSAQGDGRRRIFHLVAEEHMSGEVVGDAFIINHPDGSHEIGWGVHPALWRMGFGTEIGHVLLALSFERLNSETVWCKVMAANSASARLAKRLGMNLAESQSQYPVGHGRFEAVDVFKLSSAEYFDLPY
jgi:RimJ/RimL family protein N-acetyltransferase